MCPLYIRTMTDHIVVDVGVDIVFVLLRCLSSLLVSGLAARIVFIFEATVGSFWMIFGYLWRYFSAVRNAPGPLRKALGPPGH